MNGDGTRATTGAVARADKILHTPTDGWPSREEWAQNRRTAYGDDIDKVTEAVSSDAGDYGTTAELAHAAGELHQLWTELGRELRDANAAARSVFPLHGHRAKTRATISAIWTALEALSPEDRATVDAARLLKSRRQAIHRAEAELSKGRLGHMTTVDALRFAPADRCPTYRAIVGRWQQARQVAGEAYTEQVSRRSVGAEAWLLELDRRAQIRLARARSNLRGDR